MCCSVARHELRRVLRSAVKVWQCVCSHRIFKATQHNTILTSCRATARRLSLPTQLPGCDDVIKGRGVIRLDQWGKRLNNDWYCPYDARFPQPRPFSATYSPVSTATRHCCEDSFQLSPSSLGGLTLRLLMSYIYIYIYGAPILDVSTSHTTTQHSR